MYDPEGAEALNRDPIDPGGSERCLSDAFYAAEYDLDRDGDDDFDDVQRRTL